MTVKSPSAELVTSLGVTIDDGTPFAGMSETLSSVRGEFISADATWSRDERQLVWVLSVVFADTLLRRWEFDRYGGACSAPFL